MELNKKMNQLKTEKITKSYRLAFDAKLYYFYTHHQNI